MQAKAVSAITNRINTRGSTHVNSHAGHEHHHRKRMEELPARIQSQRRHMLVCRVQQVCRDRRAVGELGQIWQVWQVREAQAQRARLRARRRRNARITAHLSRALHAAVRPPLACGGSNGRSSSSSDTRVGRGATDETVAVSPVARELAVPACDAEAAERSPVREKCGPGPLASAVDEPKEDPHPRVAVAEAPAGPHADEAADDEHGARVEAEREEASVFRLLFREAQPTDGAPCDVPGEVQQRREEEANE